MTSPEPLVQIQYTLTEMFLIMPSTKIAQMFPLRQTKGLPDSRKEIRNCSDRSARLNKTATRAKNRNIFQSQLARPKHWIQVSDWSSTLGKFFFNICTKLSRNIWTVLIAYISKFYTILISWAESAQKHWDTFAFAHGEMGFLFRFMKGNVAQWTSKSL